MKVGLIDVDGHNFPNLALMRISAWHKAQGDEVEWWQPPLLAPWYDVVYMSKIFSNAYSNDAEEPINAGRVVKGGSGYAISLINGREVYDKSKDPDLSPEIEKMFPDYSLYPEYKYAVSMTSRGCGRHCPFCHVFAKEGHTHKVADVSDFWNGQKEIRVLDPNITACREKRDLMRQYRETGAYIDFTQGLDIRLLDDDDVADLNGMKLRIVHFAWDNPNDDLVDGFKRFADGYIGFNRGMNEVLCLTNYEDCSVEEHIERALNRVYRLQEIGGGGYNPYIMIYDKPHADKRIRMLQRWCNNKFIYRSCPHFEDYEPYKKIAGVAQR